MPREMCGAWLDFVEQARLPHHRGLPYPKLPRQS
jgi:hypothetical protein